jgi:hypothetical protein
MKLVRFASGGRKEVGVVTGDGVVEVGAALRSEGNDAVEDDVLDPLGVARVGHRRQLLRAGVPDGSESMPRRYFAAVKPPSTVRIWPVM